MTLTNNYNRLIEHVNVTPDMLVRLHEALDSGKYPRTAAHRNLRRYAALAACLAVIIGGASLLNRQPADQSGADASPDRDRRGHGIRFD